MTNKTIAIISVTEVKTAVAPPIAASSIMSALAVPQAMLVRADLMAFIAELYCGRLVCVLSQSSYWKTQ